MPESPQASWVATTPPAPSRRRPRLGRLLGVGTAALVAGGLLVGVAPAAHATGADDAAALAHLNALRAAHGLARLTESGDLNAIAASHSAAMAARETIFHNASLTSEVANWQVLGENVGMGPTVAAIDTAFDHSPEHYANEVNPAYTQVGIGTASDSRGYLYITLDFRKPMSATAPVHAASKPVVKAAPKPVVKAAAKPVVRAVEPAVATRSAAPTAAEVAAAARARAVAAAAAAQAAAAARAAADQHAAAAAAAAAAEARSAVRVASSPAWPTPPSSDPVASALAFSQALQGLPA